METVYYNFYTFEQARASGGEDHRVLLVREAAPRRRAAPQGKLISLEDYRARLAGGGLSGPEEQGGPGCGEEPAAAQPGGRRRRPRARRREALLAGLELVACGALITLAAAACAVFFLWL